MWGIMKRCIDLVFCILLLILLSPLFFVLFFVIKLSSRGPIIFKQRRIGKSNKDFFILKFRTMYIDSPKEVPTHMLEHPERFITPIGKILRKTSLDELPQLINILKGEMSFVGPRPALYNQYDLIDLRNKYEVYKVRPGITGWAQVNGRDELEISEKAEFDKFYIENHSFILDIKIIFMTFLSVISRKGVVEGKQKTKETVKG